MEPGTMVRLKADPGRVGVTTGKNKKIGPDIRWQVAFPDGKEFHKEVHLEIILDDDDEHPVDLLRQGKLGRASDLRGNLTHIRLNGRLANLIYSMDTTNTDFYAYQFKPVLNFLEAPSNGLLIADEVGLGKTIEAGLIWTELRSRFDIRRVMVLCPAMLREKWQAELTRRFGIDAAILTPRDVHRYFREYRTGERLEYAMICSMQGFRPRKGWNRDQDIRDPASMLARFVEEIKHQEPLLDLLIIDEAHYLRNPESMTSNLGRLLRDVSENVILLTATPIHLKNMDLYQLLNIVDENTFNQPNVFDEILEANAPLIQARDAVLSKELRQETFISMIEEAQAHPFFENNRQIQAILKNPPTNETFRDMDKRVDLAGRLDSINLLGKVVNRTRKREVTEWQVVRRAVPEMIPMSKPEKQFYKRVTELIREYALRYSGHEAFLLVMPQRQMSSSMPAAIREWQRKGEIDAKQIYEDLGLDDFIEDEFGPLTQELASRASEMGSYEELRQNDSKYMRLRESLISYLNKHPKEKIVLFAFFRHTLKYLKERLDEDGIKAIVLMGGARIDKHAVIERFQEEDGPNILLSSEVASEGIDLQFSRVIVNYDLPWNPMKVEQRIGRLDRLGQKSPQIAIWNLFYEDTIDARIYNRLFDRLKIFERALGGLEAILGDEIRKLTEDLLLGKLTPEQEEERIRLTELSLTTRRKKEEELEAEAGTLMAYGDYILHQVRAARELHRHISSEDIWNYIYDFYRRKYIGTEFVQAKPDELIFDVKLSDMARFDLDKYINENHLQGGTRLSYAYPQKVRCLFKNQVSSGRPWQMEIISQFHPIVRFVSHYIDSDTSFKYYSPVSVSLSRREISDIPTGVYVFSVERWSIRGIREIERIHISAGSLSSGQGMLSDDQAEKLVMTAARQGDDWQVAANVFDFNKAAELIEKFMVQAEKKYETYVEQLRYENNDRADVQEKSLKRHRDQQLEKLADLLERQIDRERIARMTRGRIEALKSRVDQKLMEIQSRRELRHLKQEICVGIIRIH
jgi:SNF2 family DNA or RNA helicase